MWNSVLAGGLSSSILVLRSGMKSIATSFITGAAFLCMIEGGMILLTSYMNRRLIQRNLELSGVSCSDLLYE